MARTKAGNGNGNYATEARWQILTAAQAVILRFGLAKTTMEDIAKEAGVSRPTVYRYFQDRTELTSALIDWRSREVLNKSKELLNEQDSFEENMVNGLIGTVSLARQDPVVSMFLGPRNQQGDSWMNVLNLAIELSHARWGEYFERMQKEGVMRDDLDQSDLYKWLALVQFSLFDLMEFTEPDDPAHARMLRNFVLPALVAQGDNALPRDRAVRPRRNKTVSA